MRTFKRSFNSGPAFVARIGPVKPRATAIRLNGPLCPFAPHAWTSSCANTSAARSPVAMHGEINISVCLSAEATGDQHSPIVRDLLENAPRDGQPHDTRMSFGTSPPACFRSGRRFSINAESHCSRFIVSPDGMNGQNHMHGSADVHDGPDSPRGYCRSRRTWGMRGFLGRCPLA